MTTVASWKDTPDYDALVEEIGDPLECVRDLDQLLASTQVTWNQFFAEQLDTSFPPPVDVEQLLAQYPNPLWPTVQSIWDELWPPPEPPIDLGFLSLPLELQEHATQILNMAKDTLLALPSEVTS